jgi:hypothetical protein
MARASSASALCHDRRQSRGLKFKLSKALPSPEPSDYSTINFGLSNFSDISPIKFNEK